MFISVFVC